MDFNLKSPDEPGYNEDPFVDDPLEVFLEEIHTLMTSNAGDRWNLPRWGLSLEHRVYENRISSESLKNRIRGAIQEFVSPSQGFTWEIDTFYVTGEVREIVVVDFSVVVNSQVKKIRYAIN